MVARHVGNGTTVDPGPKVAELCRMNVAMHRLSARVFLSACFVGGSLLTACGGGSGASQQQPQTTVETWSDYCIATMTEDHQVLDFFGDVAFTARVGEEYLIARLEADQAELVFLATTGPWNFDIDGTAETRPFTTQCAVGATTDHYAVFSDVTVFAEEELTTPLCDLDAGAVRPREPTGSGYGITGSNVGSNQTYEVILNAFSAECGGADRGYVSVPETTVHGSHTWLVPIIGIVGPA
jgi:hypothetical protein